ncbi:efflux RND transporter permease subunit [Thermophagus sp. OGC60D27]|uniref:efflux RND transporter permease subunit n=1 Tax=Thermophagus sp. OGC60D27 TaxID=3458415 RepID=UPI004037C3D2
MLNRIIKYFLENKLVTTLVLIGLVVWGISTSPFGWDLGPLPSDPVPVDAIPDIGENQQIVFTEWKGRSPQDIEDQITYPLTTYLLGIPGVKSIRSSSMFGFSSIYIIFKEDIEFYWSRSRILERLSSIPAGLLPRGVQPTLGPDATALGQVFWYTIEGRDNEGNPTGGWDLQEIRTVQDFYVKYGLNAAEGVAEVASAGGFVKEYQIDVDPSALKAYNIPLKKIVAAVKNSNRDAGAQTMEINQAEYLVRGLGTIKSLKDIEETVVEVHNHVPIRLKDVATVTVGPATRRGALDKDGAEVVGGVVVARYGANPLEVIENIKEKIKEINPGLPRKVLADGTESQLTIVPFYDRSELIYETLGTLESALSLQILITILVIVVMIYNLRASVMISALLPIAVLMVFIAMRYFGVTANIVALSGIAIAIGTMVDLGIILSENIVKRMEEASPDEKLINTIYKGASEVSSAILTAVSTTIVSFIPVFTMQGAEGKLFGPLAFTKTFALVAALLVSLMILPTLAHWFFGIRSGSRKVAVWGNGLLTVTGLTALITGYTWGGTILLLFGLTGLGKLFFKLPDAGTKRWYHWVIHHSALIISVIAVLWLLAGYWLPLGPGKSTLLNTLFVVLIVGLVLGFFILLERFYKPVLQWALEHKAGFLTIPATLVVAGVVIWLGFSTVFGFVAKGFDTIGWNIRPTKVWSTLTHTFPGIGKEFMPSLDEGSFLLMPTSMPHSGMAYNLKVLAQLDMLVSAIPEVELAVGKLGRVESALDPAPVSMFENIIQYKSEYALDERGRRMRFRTDNRGRFITQKGDTLTNDEALEQGIGKDDLIPDDDGLYFRNWRKQIQSPDDIWNEIVKATQIPGVTSAPKLQPIETRLVMLQTGMRAPMGIKVYGPDLKTIEAFGMELEKILKEVPSVKAESVFADRVIGKPYLHLNINRTEIGRYGLSVEDVLQTIETAIGGMPLTYTIEGRERYPVRVRYPRELRGDPQAMENILFATPSGEQIPLTQLVSIEYVRGPQVIKSEDTFLTGYVLFDKRDGYAEVNVVSDAQKAIQARIEDGSLTVPAGVSYRFSGNYENQVRAEKRLSVIVPLVLVIVFLILYFQFKSISTSLMIFSGIAMAFSGGFILLWLYGQGWFADFSLFGTSMRDLFQVDTVNLSVAVWVGFIALFGLATDDGVLMGTYLDQSFRKQRPSTIGEIRQAVLDGASRRIRPAVMTSATTIIALLPVLTSTGKGSDIMVPMAIPSFGGMLAATITCFVVPVLYCWREESRRQKAEARSQRSEARGQIT